MIWDKNQVLKGWHFLWDRNSKFRSALMLTLGFTCTLFPSPSNQRIQGTRIIDALSIPWGPVKRQPSIGTVAPEQEPKYHHSALSLMLTALTPAAQNYSLRSHMPLGTLPHPHGLQRRRRLQQLEQQEHTISME